jgi:hypothetical protein
MQPLRNQIIERYSTVVPKVNATQRRDVEIKPKMNRCLQLKVSQAILQRNLLKPYAIEKFDEIMPISLFERESSWRRSGKEIARVLLIEE